MCRSISSPVSSDHLIRDLYSWGTLRLPPIDRLCDYRTGFGVRRQRLSVELRSEFSDVMGDFEGSTRRESVEFEVYRTSSVKEGEGVKVNREWVK